MPRSWRQKLGGLVAGFRDLLAEVRETFRLHFKQVTIHAWPLSFWNWVEEIEFWIRPEIYGGLLYNQDWPVREIPMFVGDTTVNHPLSLAVDCHVSGQAETFGNVVLHQVSCDFDISRHLKREPVLPRQVKTDGSKGYAMRKARCDGWIKSQIALPSKVRTESVAKPRIHKARVFSLKHAPTSKAFAYPIAQKAFPISRKAIPPHRFSTTQRQQFRELLAQKAGLPVNDLTIVGVYDRVFLASFQSLGQDEEGNLFGVPKKPGDPALQNPNQIPVYLIIGKSGKAPGKSFQAIMPMHE